MPSVSGAIELYDRMSRPAMNMANAMNSLVDVMLESEAASKGMIDVSSLEAAQDQAARAALEFEQLKKDIEGTGEASSRAGNEAEGMFSKIASGAAVAQLAIKALEKAWDAVTSKFEAAQERIDVSERFMRNVATLSGDAEQAEIAMAKVRDIVTDTAYSLNSAAGAVQGFQLSRGLATAVADVEALSNAVAFFGDGTSAALDQATTAWGKIATSGKVYAQQVNSLIYSGVPAWNLYAEAVGMSVSEVQAAVTAGEIDATNFLNTVQSAIQEGAGIIPSLADAAKTAGQSWGATWENAGAAITRGVVSVIDRIEQELERFNLDDLRTQIIGVARWFEGVIAAAGELGARVVQAVAPLQPLFADLANVIGSVFSAIYDVALVVVGALSLVTQGIAQLYEFVRPAFELVHDFFYDATNGADLLVAAVGGLVAAFATYHGILIAVKVATVAYHGVQALAAALTGGWTAAQLALNAAMQANPIVFIISLIVGLVTAIAAVIAKTRGWADETTSAVGMITGSIAVGAAFVYNTVLGLINGLIELVWTVFAYPFLSIVEWIINVANGGFNTFGDAVANLIGQIIGWFLNLGKVVTKIIDAIFGTDWTAGLTSLQDSVLAWGKNDSAITLDRTAPTVGTRKSYEEAFAAGSQWGDNLGTSEPYNYETVDYSQRQLYDDIADISAASGNTADNTEQLAKVVENMSSELDYLLKISERNAIEDATVNVSVDFSNMSNSIANDVDVDGLVRGMENSVEGAVETALEAVFSRPSAAGVYS